MDNLLSPDAIRVLGVLIEKEYSTPEYYPMTLNALVNGCNQKSNRDPVVAFSQSEVRTALDELIRLRLGGHASIAGSRAEKFRHAAAQHWTLEAPSLAILASLMLRGAQTVGELRTHTARMASFDSIDQVAELLAEMMEREEPLVTSVGRRPGQKGERFAHLLSGEPATEDESDASVSAPSGEASSSEMQDLRDRITQLEQEFEAFKRQFE